MESFLSPRRAQAASCRKTAWNDSGRRPGRHRHNPETVRCPGTRAARSAGTSLRAARPLLLSSFESSLQHHVECGMQLAGRLSRRARSSPNRPFDVSKSWQAKRALFDCNDDEWYVASAKSSSSGRFSAIPGYNSHRIAQPGRIGRAQMRCGELLRNATRVISSAAAAFSAAFCRRLSTLARRSVIENREVTKDIIRGREEKRDVRRARKQRQKLVVFFNAVAGELIASLINTTRKANKLIWALVNLSS